MTISISFAWPDVAGDLQKTMGGPTMRNRSERLVSSLLGKTDGEIRMPKLHTLGFSIPTHVNVLEHAFAVLHRNGFESPEQLRGQFETPQGPSLVAPSQSDSFRLLTALTDAEFLTEALVLGLCTKSVYDPKRPVLWTMASLSRKLDVFPSGGFYALD